MNDIIMMAFSVDFNDEGVDQIIRDYNGANIGMLLIPECKMSFDSAVRLKSSIIYHSVAISSSIVPGENIIQLIPDNPISVIVNNTEFQSNPSPFDQFNKTIEELDFSNTNLDDRAFESFRGSKSIKKLSCINTNISIGIVDIAVTCKKLVNLNIAGNNVTIFDLASRNIPRNLNVAL
jgi:hypothetical protein